MQYFFFFGYVCQICFTDIKRMQVEFAQVSQCQPLPGFTRNLKDVMLHVFLCGAFNYDKYSVQCSYFS